MKQRHSLLLLPWPRLLPSTQQLLTVSQKNDSMKRQEKQCPPRVAENFASHVCLEDFAFLELGCMYGYSYNFIQRESHLLPLVHTHTHTHTYQANRPEIKKEKLGMTACHSNTGKNKVNIRFLLKEFVVISGNVSVSWPPLPFIFSRFSSLPSTRTPNHLFYHAVVQLIFASSSLSNSYAQSFTFFISKLLLFIKPKELSP